MSDYISREELILRIRNKIYDMPKNSDETMNQADAMFTNGLYRALDLAEHMPSADVRENIYGEWEEVTNYKDDNVYQWHIICSVCRQRGMFESDNFCPNCGADMRGEE